MAQNIFQRVLKENELYNNKLQEQEEQLKYRQQFDVPQRPVLNRGTKFGRGAQSILNEALGPSNMLDVEKQRTNQLLDQYTDFLGNFRKQSPEKQRAMESLQAELATASTMEQINDIQRRYHNVETASSVVDGQVVKGFGPENSKGLLSNIKSGLNNVGTYFKDNYSLPDMDSILPQSNAEFYKKYLEPDVSSGSPVDSSGPPVDPIQKAVLENNVPPEVLQEVEPQPVSPVNNSLSNEGLGRLNAANLEGLGQDIERTAPPEPQSKGMLDGLRNVLQNPDFNDVLVQHLQGMSVNPNKEVIKRAGDNILLRKGKAELNRTADYVENTLGNKAYADAIREGFMTPADALASLTGTGTQTDAFKTLHQKAIAGGLTAGTEEYQKYMASNGNYDAEKQKLTTEGTMISAKNVLESIADIRAFVLGAEGPLGNNVTGLQGKIAAKIAGTDAYNVSKISNTIKANIGFDRLTAMREASPTGGALGQVSNIEIELLQSTIKSLDQFVSTDVYLKNLESIETQYKEILRKAALYYDPEVLKESGVDQLLLNSNMYGKNSTGKIIKFNMQGERI
jgi:hypothetical protein